jgi:hypothetical protein
MKYLTSANNLLHLKLHATNEPLRIFISQDLIYLGPKAFLCSSGSQSNHSLIQVDSVGSTIKLFKGPEKSYFYYGPQRQGLASNFWFSSLGNMGDYRPQPTLAQISFFTQEFSLNVDEHSCLQRAGGVYDKNKC